MATSAANDLTAFDSFTTVQNETFRDAILDDATCIADDVTFEGCEFVGGQFSGTPMTRLVFVDCDFTDCRFDSAALEECRFSHCRFYDRDNETGCSFRFVSAPGSCFEQSDLSMCSFERAALHRVQIRDCQAQGASFVQCDVSHLIGGSVRLHEFSMTDSNLAYADFTGAYLAEAELSGNRFSHVIMDRACLRSATLTDCDLHGIEASGLELVDADLRGSQVTGLDIRKIDVSGVRIDQVQQGMLLTAIGMIVD